MIILEGEEAVDYLGKTRKSVELAITATAQNETHRTYSPLLRAVAIEELFLKQKLQESPSDVRLPVSSTGFPSLPEWYADVRSVYSDVQSVKARRASDLIRLNQQLSNPDRGLVMQEAGVISKRIEREDGFISQVQTLCQDTQLYQPQKFDPLKFPFHEDPTFPGVMVFYQTNYRKETTRYRLLKFIQEPISDKTTRKLAPFLILGSFADWDQTKIDLAKFDVCTDIPKDRMVYREDLRDWIRIIKARVSTQHDLTRQLYLSQDYNELLKKHNLSFGDFSRSIASIHQLFDHMSSFQMNYIEQGAESGDDFVATVDKFDLSVKREIEGLPSTDLQLQAQMIVESRKSELSEDIQRAASQLPPVEGNSILPVPSRRNKVRSFILNRLRNI